jgi:GH24 family phage-related lysozyme (muramidase)
METSRLGILFIARREGLVLTAYKDGEHYSIGFGHNDPELEEGDKITVKQAFALLKSDIKKREIELAKMLGQHTVPQHVYDAFMDLLFNRGHRAARSLVEVYTKQGPDAAATELLNWGVNARGDPMAGVYKRRKLAVKMMLEAQYGEVSPIPYWTGNPRTTDPKQYHVQDDDL